MIGQANGMLVRRCMARFGFGLPVPMVAGTASESINSRRDPLAPLDDPRFGRGAPTRIEIAVWSAVEAGDQHRQIAEHRDALEQVRGANQTLLTNAADVVASAEPSAGV